MVTLGFREKEKGWASFFSYLPEGYLRLGNTFFSLYGGNLWEHNDKSNPVTNTFYGTTYPSKISTIFNDIQTEDKIFKTFVIEGNAPWDIYLKTNLTKTSLSQSDFDRRESRYFTHLRGNENEQDFSGNIEGIGVCNNHTEKEIHFELVGEFTNIGDKVFRLNDEKEEFVGTIISKTKTSITLDKEIDSAKGYFFFSSKDSRVEGGEIRGYYAQVDMENNDKEQLELFAINSNIIKSYV